MYKFIEPYVLSFIPIFVAVDAIGNIPIFMSLMDGADKEDRHKVIMDSVITAAAMAIIFMLAGKAVLRFIGITIPDFQVAGGVLLFIIAVRLLLPGGQKGMMLEGHGRNVGAFPLGTPLITGPAVLTTTLMMVDTFGIVPTFISLAINMFIVWITLAKSEDIMRSVDANGARAFSKIMDILLAAIGVMMVRKGLVGFLK